MTEHIIAEMDRLVKEASRINQTPRQLLDTGAELSGVRYTLSTLLAEAEIESLRWEQEYKMFLVVMRLSLQENNTKLSSTKAADQSENTEKAKELRGLALNAKATYLALKNRLHSSENVVMSLAQRAKRAEAEAMEARYQQQPR